MSLEAVRLRCEDRIDPVGIDSRTPRVSWSLIDDAPGESCDQSAYQIVARRAGHSVYDSGKVVSRQTLYVPLPIEPLQTADQIHWKLRVWDQHDRDSPWSAAATFTTAVLDSQDWRAHWISYEPATFASSNLPQFRRNISLDKNVSRAVVFVCGLGQHEVQINGQKVGEDRLEPGWTNYAKTCLYVAHECGDLLKAGENQIDVLLGNGMYNVTGGRYAKFRGSFGQPMLLLQLHVFDVDGTQRIIGTDPHWQVAPGPITFSCIYGGEDYDARATEPQADTWHAAVVTRSPGQRLIPQQSPPIRVAQTFRPINVKPLEDGTAVYDFGQNFAGQIRLTTTAKRGETIKLVPAELLDPTGRPMQKPVGSPVSFSYTARGGGQQRWQPRFSYYGARYVQALGGPVSELEGQFVHAAVETVGAFKCSDPLLNQIHEMITLAIRSNLQSVLTDCPHREKLGWLEQSHLMGAAIFDNYDVKTFYEKVSADVRDAQHADGCVPTIAPQYTVFQKPWTIYNDSPEWGAACVLNPWLTFTRSGDVHVLEENFESTKRFVNYLRSRSENDLLSYGLGDWYDVGDGDPGFSKLTTLGLTATAIYFQCVSTMARIASTLGLADQAAEYTRDAERIRIAFNGRFFDAALAQYDTGSQTSNAMPLALGIVDEPNRAAVLANLVNKIHEDGKRITAGDVGFRYVVDALGSADRSDLVFDMVTRRDGPGYAMQLDRGATALTEAWDANQKSSQNHLMLGHAEVWFHRYLAGIDVDLSRTPDEQIIIRPADVPGIDWVEASYESALGLVSVHWRRSSGGLRLTLSIPPNARATVQLPSAAAQMFGAGMHIIEQFSTPM